VFPICCGQSGSMSGRMKSNLDPELRWKKGKPGAFGSSLL